MKYKVGDKFKLISKDAFSDETYELICTENEVRQKVIALGIDSQPFNRWNDAIEVKNLDDITQEELDLILKCDVEHDSFIKIDNLACK